MPDLSDEEVFKALADHSRRQLLDALFVRDGQTLGQLCDGLAMTRFGVMKHLQLLEDAHLLTTRKSGREKLHFLNPVPIQQVYDRWVSKYAKPFAQSLTALKFALENEPMTAMPDHVMQIYIRTTPEKLWYAITDGDITPHYYFASRLQSTWEIGASYQYLNEDGGVMLHGKIVEIDPPKRLIMTFTPSYDPSALDHVSTVIWEIEPEGNLCRLTLTHQGLEVGTELRADLADGWSRILSGLKTYLETGASLN